MESVSKCLNMSISLQTIFAKSVLFILTTLGTKISSVLLLLSMHTEIKISDLFKQSLKHVLLSERFKFQYMYLT